jgi:hypothetical protein
VPGDLITDLQNAGVRFSCFPKHARTEFIHRNTSLEKLHPMSD